MTNKDDKPSSTLKLSLSGNDASAPKLSTSSGGAQVEVRKVRAGAPAAGGLKTPGLKTPGLKTPVSGIKTPGLKTGGIKPLTLKTGGPAKDPTAPEAPTAKAAPSRPAPNKIQIKKPANRGPSRSNNTSSGDSLTNSEREGRFRALELAQKANAERAEREAAEAKLRAEREALDKQRAEEDRLKAEAAEAKARENEQEHEKKAREEEELRKRVESEARIKLEAEDKARREKAAERQNKSSGDKGKAADKFADKFAGKENKPAADAGSDFLAGGRIKKAKQHVPTTRDTAKKNVNDRRRGSKISVSKALSEDEDRMRSLASIRRRREKEKMDATASRKQGGKVVRDVVVPDTITVQELANRMAERGGDVVKSLMKMGMMVTINQTIDADTAELVVEEFGHKLSRISAEDVEVGIRTVDDAPESLKPRAPVVTVMGHVDHGKTSLLDALRSTNVVKGEAGGITQHIGAYQVELSSGDKMTFVDTPGHAAFSEMRARGANVTDIVVLVVAADDGIMPQTIEAISHARAAEVPIIVAINKMDKPGADPQKVITSLLQHEIVTEDMGGETIAVPVSAKTGLGLDTLQENIILQAELLELKANPDREAEGVVVESKLETGRGAVATVLVQKGTLKVGDTFVMGEQWGRVRALVNDQGKQVKKATPSEPVEVLGLQGSPRAGDEFLVVESEQRAREVSEYRKNLAMEKRQAAAGTGTLEQMFADIKTGVAKQLGIVIKADVQGSVEAIDGALAKYSNDEVAVKTLLGQVGAITEADIRLASASKAMVVGFNVRANPQARDLAKRDGVDIRYYSIIYELIDDVKGLLSGMLKPELRENFLGYATIRETFNVTKIGKVAGCIMTDGVVRRNCGVRLLRDNVVIHEGKLKTLKRFKEEVSEVRNGTECGMAFENYQDIQVGDQIECFEVESIARTIDG